MEPGFQIPDAIRNGQTFRTRPGAGDLIQVCILLLAEDALRTQHGYFAGYCSQRGRTNSTVSLCLTSSRVLNEVKAWIGSGKVN